MKKIFFIIVTIIVLIVSSTNIFASCSDTFKWETYKPLYLDDGLDDATAEQKAKELAKYYCISFGCDWFGDRCFDPLESNYNESLVDGKIKDTVGNIWATFRTIIQVFAVGCVVFAGVRYMFASADQRADIKKGLKFLVVGAVLVFSAITVIDLVVKIFKDVL